MIELHKFIVASKEKDAVTTLSVWNTHLDMRACLSDTVFDDWEAAERQCAEKIQRAKDESPFGCGVPCDEHSRCVGFDPKVWEVRLSVGLGAEATKKFCGCEHVSHFPEDGGKGHPHGGAVAGQRRAEHVGPVCDDCADTHMADCLISK